jgi:Ca-activated chloride channel family protein
MTTLQRAVIILGAFGVISILLTQVNSPTSNSLIFSQLTIPSKNINEHANVPIKIGTDTDISSHSAYASKNSSNHQNIPDDGVNNIYETGSGSFYFQQTTHDSSVDAHQYETVKLQSTSAEIAITGQIARTKLTQVFTNTSEQTKNGIYTFPLPQDAAVDQLIMQVGNRKIKGLIKRKDLAEKIYKQSKSQGKKASLNVQLRLNIFTSEVANIPPQSSISVTLFYQQLVARNKHTYALRLPLSTNPRYQTARQAANKRAILPASTHIKVRLNTGFPVSQISSKHHPIKTTNTYTTQYEIELDTTQPANKDFVLSWQLQPSYNVQASHFRYQSDNFEYGLVTLIPPVSDEIIAKRNVVFILDVSGSMLGEPITQAKQALALAIQDLHENDYFNVVAFNVGANTLWSASHQADAKAKQDALAYIYDLRASNGSDIKTALKTAFALHPIKEDDAFRLHQIVLVTNGKVSNEDKLMHTIYQQLGQYSLFTVGIGNAPNPYFMTEAAAAGKGSYTFINDISQVKSSMQDLLEKLKHPALTNIELGIKDIQHVFGYEVYPSILPDLYADEPLLISYRREINTSNIDLTLPFSVQGQFLKNTGQSGLQKRAWDSELPFIVSDHTHGLDKHWARLKIKDLRQQLNMKGRFNVDYKTMQHNVREGIINVALNHHLVSQYTSLIAVDHITSQLDFDAHVTSIKPEQYAYAKHTRSQLPTARSSVVNVVIVSLLVVLSICLFFVTDKHN